MEFTFYPGEPGKVNALSGKIEGCLFPRGDNTEAGWVGVLTSSGVLIFLFFKLKPTPGPVHSFLCLSRSDLSGPFLTT